MARTLTPTITAALAAGHAQPTVTLASADLQPRPSLLTTTGLPPARTAAILTAAGTLLRASVSQPSNPAILSIYRIPSPTSPTHWSDPAVSTTSARAASGAAFAQSGSLIRLFFCDALVLKCTDSTDDGLTWSAPTTIAGLPDPSATECTGLAAPDPLTLYSAWYDYPQAASALYQNTFSAGAWSAYTSVGPTSPTWGQLRGISAAAAPSGHTILKAGVQTRAQLSGIAGAYASYDGSTWSAFLTLHPLDTPNNGQSYANPTIHTDGTDLYSAFQLQDDGSVSGSAQNRATVWSSADSGLTWSPLLHLGNLFAYELHAVPGAAPNQLLLFDNSSVYLTPSTPTPPDITSDLLSLSITEHPNTPATFDLTLDNSQGQYTALAALRDNAQVTISLGYNGSAILTHHAYIDAVALTAGPHAQSCSIRARDRFKFLDLANPTLTTFPTSGVSVSVGQLITAICALAAVPLASLPSTTQFSEPVSTFSLLPGETFLAALVRLASLYDFQMRIANDTLTITERSAADPSSWSYDQSTLAAAWQHNADQPTIIRVVGQSSAATNVFAEAIDTPTITATGARRYSQIVDRLLATPAQCALKAALALRDAQTLAQTGDIAIPLNPTHELMDVIALTDPRLGLSAQHARIHAIQTTIDHTSGQLHQSLSLRLP